MMRIINIFDLQTNEIEELKDQKRVLESKMGM